MITSFTSGSKTRNLVYLQTVLYVTSIPIRPVDVRQPRAHFEALRFAILRFNLLFTDSVMFAASVISAATLIKHGQCFIELRGWEPGS